MAALAIVLACIYVALEIAQGVTRRRREASERARLLAYFRERLGRP